MSADLQTLQRLYDAYVDTFRAGGELPPMMRLKREHTAFVVANARAIAAGEGFDARTARAAEAAALLHDTGCRAFVVCCRLETRNQTRNNKTERNKQTMKTKALIRTAFAAVAATIAAAADLPPAPTVGACDEITIAVIETRAGDDSCRTPDNPGGWIETRPCDADEGVATIDTVKKVGFKIDLR